MKPIAGVRTEPAADHEWSSEALPWYVNASLDERATLRMEQHLAACAACRAELARNRLLFSPLRDAGSVDLAPQSALAAVMERIERRETWRRRFARPFAALLGERGQRPLALALAVQALVIVMLTAVLGVVLHDAPEAAYRTLSSSIPDAAGGTQLRVVLDDGLTLGELQELLQPWGGRVIAGPEGRGIYTVVIQARAELALPRLRAHRGVLLAEPVSGP
jgi:anti-sigma factor RsiW